MVISRLFSLSCLLLLVAVSPVSARVIGGGTMMDQPMEENLCALTFDDGPSIFTPQLLDMLKEYEIPATFFMLGQMVNHYPEIVRRVAAEGHEIASHTYSHKNLKKLGYTGQLQEIERGYDSLAALGIIPRYVRPPYGSYDDRTTQIADSFGLNVVLWSVDSRDWKHLPEDYTLMRSVRGSLFPEGGMYGVFLFHDIHQKTVEDLPRIVAQLKQAGCQRFVTLSDYLEGILDPEPPLLMSRRTVRQEIPATVPSAPQEEGKQPYETPVEEQKEPEDVPGVPAMPVLAEPDLPETSPGSSHQNQSGAGAPLDVESLTTTAIDPLPETPILPPQEEPSVSVDRSVPAE